MKTFQLLLLCFICTAKTYGQVVVEIKKQKNPDSIYIKAELKSAGLDSSLLRFLEKNINRSLWAGREVKEGKYIVAVKFIVAKDGSLSDISCENDPGFGMCGEVKRVLVKSKRWGPAKPVEVRAYRGSN